MINLNVVEIYQRKIRRFSVGRVGLVVEQTYNVFTAFEVNVDDFESIGIPTVSIAEEYLSVIVAVDDDAGISLH